jgi:hypothetical protein
MAVRLRQMLQRDGICTMPNFMSSSNRAEAMKFLETSKPYQFQSSQDIFQNKLATIIRPHTDFSFNPSPNHNIVVQHLSQPQFSLWDIYACDQIPSFNPLFHLYHSEEFITLVESIVGKKLYRSEDPLSAIHVLKLGTGGVQGFHFEEAEFTTTLILQEPEVGG